MTNSRNILIIDDDGDFANLLTEILIQANYKVKTCPNAMEGLEAVQKENFDLVVIDQRLSGMTGCETLEKIRAKSKLPVVVVSGFLEPSSTQNFINLGISGIFFKPLNIFALLERFEEIFKGTVISSGLVVPPMKTEEMRGLTRTPFISPVVKEVFLKKVQALAPFKGVLLLLGDDSSAFIAVAEEITKRSSERLIAWKNPKNEELKKYFSTSEPITFMIRSVKEISEEEKSLIYKVAKHEAPFEKAPSVRFIFCLEEDLDTLYENGVIDDEMYLFMGNIELRLPRADGLKKTHSSVMDDPKETVKRVLVLDDEDLHAQMLIDLLETANYKGIKFNSPADALAALKKERFSLIITDFRMPGINGVDFVSQARAIEPMIPLFIVTGNIQLPEMVRIANMGITQLISKPIDTKKFIEEVAKVIKANK